MDRKGRTIRKRSLRFLLIAACASLAAVSSVRAVDPVTAAPATRLADGIWTVQRRAIHGTRRSADWLIRLTNRHSHAGGGRSLKRPVSRGSIGDDAIPEGTRARRREIASPGTARQGRPGDAMTVQR